MSPRPSTSSSSRMPDMSSGIYRLLSFVSANRRSYLSGSRGTSTPTNSSNEPQILLVVAGGTICMQDSEDGLVTSKLFLDECLRHNPTYDDGTPVLSTKVTNEHGKLIEAPTLRLPRDRNGENVRCSVLEFDPLLDSSTAHAPTWNQLAQTIRANEDNFDAFVICHGTDTLGYTSAALSFMLMDNLQKTVVLTGAQRSMFFADSDGSDNLLGSIVLASHLKIPEVCVYFGHKLLRGTRITKISASSYSGFESPNAGPLATVSETGIVVHWDNLLHDPPPQVGKAVPVMDSSKVVVIKVWPGITSQIIDAILSPKTIRGVVLETFGAGNMPLSIIPALSAAVQRGVVIVNVTQCLHGSVSDSYEPARKLVEAGIQLGHDMTTEAAYTKLVYLLSSKGATPENVAKDISQNIRGELTPPSEHLSGGPMSIAQLPIRYERTMPGHVNVDHGTHHQFHLGHF
ncbi:60 kDa lysophospholipase [Cercospora beticola]|uniref:asparaginase n=2 Tax=Cercospora beticola TaxID=122368 RepID=A0A2G5HPH3_CERBT|nr:60 kDa lysophospholipase [Cercospora beticola]PIA94408.1 60 kDa lysophospholipase [Cercospora beticola]